MIALITKQRKAAFGVRLRWSRESTVSSKATKREARSLVLWSVENLIDSTQKSIGVVRGNMGVCLVLNRLARSEQR